MRMNPGILAATRFPASLLAGGVPGLVIDPAASGAIVDSGSNSIPLTLGGGIGVASSGGLTYADFDGVDDTFRTTSNFDLSARDKFTLVYSILDNCPAIRMLVEHSVNAGSNPGGFNTYCRATVNGDVGWGLQGTDGIGVQTSTGAGIPSTKVVSAYFDLAGATRETEIFPRVDGVIPALTWAGAASAGTGNLGNYVTYFGARAGTSLFFLGRLYWLGLFAGDHTAHLPALEAIARARAGL